MAHFFGAAPDRLLPAGTHLSVMAGWDGEREILRWRLPRDLEVEAVSLALTIWASKYQQVPRHCVHLLWELPADSTPPLVRVILTKVTYFDAWQHDGCVVCGDPPDMCHDSTHGEYCGRCQPELLCQRCSLATPGGLCCLLCLEASEEGLMSEAQAERWQLCVGEYPRDCSNSLTG